MSPHQVLVLFIFLSCGLAWYILPALPLLTSSPPHPSLSLLCSARSQCSNGCISQITIPSNDTYTFATYGNAGVRMWLGGHLLIDDVASVTPRINVSSCFFSFSLPPSCLFVYHLSPGKISVINTTLSTQSYTLRVEMYKLNTSEAFTSLQVMWKITGSSSLFSVVPSEYLFPEVR